MSTVKRVISHPEEVGRNNVKISKQSSQTELMETKADNLAPAMSSLAIASDVNKVETENEDIPTIDNHIDEIVMDYVEKDKILNEKENIKSNKQMGGEAQPQTPSGEDIHPEEQQQEENQENSGFARQVSVDTSNTKPSTAAPPRVIEVPNAIGSSTSVIRNKSESTVSSAAATAAKDWGFFEYIDDHSSKGKSPDGEKKVKKGDKKTGLLLFDDLVNPLNEIVAKQKNGGKSKIKTYSNSFRFIPRCLIQFFIIFCIHVILNRW